MSEHVKDFIMKTLAGEKSAAADSLDIELKSRITDRMEAEKINIAQNLFHDEDDVEDELEYDDDDIEDDEEFDSEEDEEQYEED